MADMVGSLLNQNQNQAEEDQPNVRVTTAGVNLPPELIYEIVCRLPAKGVGRFRCASKEWKILLSNPKFLKNHFNFSKNQTKLIVNGNNNFSSIHFRNDCTNESQPVAIFETLTFMTNKFKILGSCNGLILLFDYKNLELSIANPITHKMLQLPAKPRNIDCVPAIGFGYCLNDDEYTVIIAKNGTPSSPVYMLKNNLWKRVEDSPLGLLGIGTYVNGSIHWLAYQDSDNSFVVYAFDLASERFREVEKPEGLKENNRFVVSVLDGCLCLVCYRYSTTDFWVMKKYGLTDSWTMYVAYADELNLHPLFFWNRDESIVARSQGRLNFCCLKQKTSAIIHQFPLSCSGVKWTFVDSLFSPNSSNALAGPNQVQV